MIMPGAIIFVGFRTYFSRLKIVIDAGMLVIVNLLVLPSISTKFPRSGGILKKLFFFFHKQNLDNYGHRKPDCEKSATSNTTSRPISAYGPVADK